MKKKTAVYIRTSKKEQNLENQRLVLVEFAKKNKWDYKIFEEKESTRKTRPVKQEVLKLLRQKQFERLLIWKLDRWARSMTELILELEELYKKGIEIFSYTDTLDFSTATGRLQSKMLFAFAEFERDLISERTILGLDRARAEGKTLGRPKKLKG